MVPRTEGMVEVSTPLEWMKWPHRAEAEGITYAPGGGRIVDGGKLNLWEGWGVKPVPKPIFLFTFRRKAY